MDFVMVTNWEKVPLDDFYLSDKEAESRDCDIKKLRKMAQQEELFYGYVVGAQNYCVYKQMTAEQILIDEDGTCLLHCEGEVIGNEHEHCEVYEM